jgi:site-specific DNA-methyltransferase (adenine-specific)
MSASDIAEIARDAWTEGRDAEARRILDELGPALTIHRGDCIGGLGSLDDASVDVTITDPPYEIEAHTKGKRQGKSSGRGREECGKKYARVVDEEFDFFPITEAQRRDVGREIARVTRKWIGVFCQVEAIHLWRGALERDGFVYRRTIPWVKPDAMPSLHGKWPGQAFEAIVVLGRPSATAPIGGKARYYQATRERGDTRAHPTAKPIALMRQIVEDFTEFGDLVCDPFAGSGSTGFACKMLGRRFVGWELNNTYYLTALRRLNGEVARPTLRQPSLFGGAL